MNSLQYPCVPSFSGKTLTECSQPATTLLDVCSRQFWEKKSRSLLGEKTESGRVQGFFLDNTAASHTELSMLSILEYPSEETASSSVRSILESWESYSQKCPQATYQSWQEYQQRYYLSQKAKNGLLRRAGTQKVKLPRLLKLALQSHLTFVEKNFWLMRSLIISA